MQSLPHTSIAPSTWLAIATIARQLESVPEGNGTKLDHTLIVYMATNGRDHHCGEDNFPIMLLGNLGGRLKKGRYYAPCNSNGKKDDTQTRVGDVWATLLAAASQPHKEFGIPHNGISYEPIQWLMA